MLPQPRLRDGTQILQIKRIYTDLFSRIKMSIENKFFAYTILCLFEKFAINTSLLTECPSPDGSKYPFMPGFGIKDIADSWK